MCAVQAKEIELALRSGVHGSVSWSLNVLTVLSFNAPHHLLLADHPHLLEALLQVCLKTQSGSLSIVVHVSHMSNLGP